MGRKRARIEGDSPLILLNGLFKAIGFLIRVRKQSACFGRSRAKLQFAGEFVNGLLEVSGFQISAGLLDSFTLSEYRGE